jgi:hypothetical protein
LQSVALDWPSQAFISAHATTHLCASEDTPRFAESIEFPTMTAAELPLDTVCVQLSR